MEAEKTRDSLTQILDNMPDAVLMLESQQLQYCNQQADRFFGVSLSHLSPTILKGSQYLITTNRCMHELSSSKKLETESDTNCSIKETELG